MPYEWGFFLILVKDDWKEYKFVSYQPASSENLLLPKRQQSLGYLTS